MEEVSQGETCESVQPTQQMLPTCAERACCDHDAEIYWKVFTIVTDIPVLSNASESQESSYALTEFILDFEYPDGHSHISQYLVEDSHPDLIRGRVLEAFAHWVRKQIKTLDAFGGPPSQADVQMFGLLKNHLEWECGEHPHSALIAKILRLQSCQMVGRDAVCLANVLSVTLLEVYSRSDTIWLVGFPEQLLAIMVSVLEGELEKLSWEALDIYDKQCFRSFEDCTNKFMDFFTAYTVDPCSGGLVPDIAHPDFANKAAEFKVHLVNTCGSLMRLLVRIEAICQRERYNAVFAVDFQGVELSRYGELCLMQFACLDDPSLVYVIDVHVLGDKAFTLKTFQGTCIEGVLEDGDVRKVWFDPRNDVDALYHKFGVLAKGIFDLQLADVVHRRNRGVNVHHVYGLHDCLTECGMLSAEEQALAKKIDSDCKNLYEPQYGGTYEIFKQRPLHHSILVYAAHECRYMICLYLMYLGSIGPQWVGRVMESGFERELWCLSKDYRVPGSEAPDI